MRSTARANRQSIITKATASASEVLDYATDKHVLDTLLCRRHERAELIFTAVPGESPSEMTQVCIHSMNLMSLALFHDFSKTNHFRLQEKLP